MFPEPMNPMLFENCVTMTPLETFQRPFRHAGPNKNVSCFYDFLGQDVNEIKGKRLTLVKEYNLFRTLEIIGQPWTVVFFL
jgi:hypothetical protein